MLIPCPSCGIEADLPAHIDGKLYFGINAHPILCHACGVEFLVPINVIVEVLGDPFILLEEEEEK